MDPEETSHQPSSGEEGPHERTARPLDRWILPFFSDSTLWPVTLVGALILVTFGAAVVLFALLERNRFALAALVILVGVSADTVYRDVRRRRFGALSRVVVCLWGLVCVAAVALRRFGAF